MRIAVIGIGVIGMSSAHELSREHDVTVFHDKALAETTSAIATAIWHVYLVDPDDPLHLDWSARTLSRLMGLIENPATSVELCDGIELFVHGDAFKPSWSRIAQRFDLVATEDFRRRYPGRRWGYRIAAPAANMEKYLPWLYQACVNRGATFVRRHVHALEELLDDFELVINCAGLGAAALTDDDKLYPVKGQYLVLDVADDAPKEYLGDDQHPEGMAYVIPRDGQILVGGTEEANKSDLAFTVDRDALIRRASQFIDYDLTQLRELGTAVGLRPCRTDRRVRFGLDDCEPRIIHNYGHGGSGFSLAWGCAEDVAKLVRAIGRPRGV